MIVLVGASASGKTELSKILFKEYGYKKCITTTTRVMRDNEQQGVDYHFLTKEAFETKISEGAFYEVTSYQNHYYGIQKKDVNENGLVIVDPNGANKLVECGSDVFVVYIEASEALRKRRMEERNDEPLLIQKRIEGDRETFDLKHFIRIDLHIYNEVVSLESIANKIHEAYQRRHH
jgi:guanylate kinase